MTGADPFEHPRQPVQGLAATHLVDADQYPHRLADVIETDLVDPRYFSSANVKNRLESYFQMIEQKRRGGGSPSKAA